MYLKECKSHATEIPAHLWLQKHYSQWLNYGICLGVYQLMNG
jgi:hypothetical protein